jgi:3-hydroxyacyl-CoA dehydrogenase
MPKCRWCFSTCRPRKAIPNGIVKKAIDGLKKLEPSPLATKDRVAYIDAANYEQHLEQLKGCDLIIEAIAEKMEWKDDLYRKIAPFISPDAIIASNTSGLSINRLSEGLPEACARTSAASISSTRRATCTWSN